MAVQKVSERIECTTLSVGLKSVNCVRCRRVRPPKGLSYVRHSTSSDRKASSSKDLVSIILTSRSTLLTRCGSHLWFKDDWSIFMISSLNEQLQQQLEYTLLKPDCHCWWFSKMQSGFEDNLEERYATKFCFKHGKNATETYGMLQTAFRQSCMNRASVFEWHKRFKEGRESLRDDERCGRRKEVNTPELIGQRLRVRRRVTMLRF